MAFYINENTDIPEILTNGGSLKVGKGLNISDDELVAIGEVSKDELNTILQNYLSLNGGTLTDGVTITPEGITINNQFTSWSDILNVSKGDSTKYLTEHQKLKTLNGASLVGEGNVEIVIPEVDFSEIQTQIDANRNSISSHTSSIQRLESNINGALASIETKANKSDLDNYVSTEAFANFESSYDSAKASIETRLTAIESGDGPDLSGYLTTEAFANFQSDYDSAQSQLGTRLTSIEGNVQRNTSSIATLTSNLESANANISTNAGKITNLTNELGVVNGKVETNSQSILDLNSEIDNAQATLSAHTSSISTLNDKVSGLESTTSTNSQSILQLTTDLQQARADIQTTHSEITGLQNSIDGKLDTSDFWTTLGYNSEEEFKQAISESGLTQEQIDALRDLTDGEYLSTDSFLELISDEDFASSAIGSRLLEITKNNVDDQTIIDVVTSESALNTLATAVGASSELTNKFATIQSVEDLSDDLATETTNRTEAISSLQQTVNDKISSAELQTSLESYYDKSTVDGIVESAKTEARSGLLLESDLDSAIADLGTYYTKSEVNEAISESSADFVAQSDYDTAQASMSSRIDDVEASAATAVTRDPDTGKVISTVTFGADNAELNEDGSGYMAYGNFSWDDNGNITILTKEDENYNKNILTITEEGLEFTGQGIRAGGSYDLSLSGIDFARPANSGFNPGGRYQFGANVNGLSIYENVYSTSFKSQINLSTNPVESGTGTYNGFNPALELYDGMSDTSDYGAVFTADSVKFGDFIKGSVGNSGTYIEYGLRGIKSTGGGVYPLNIYSSTNFNKGFNIYDDLDQRNISFNIGVITIGNDAYLQIANGLLVDSNGNLGVKDGNTFKQGATISSSIDGFINRTGGDPTQYTIKNGLIVEI